MTMAEKPSKHITCVFMFAHLSSAISIWLYPYDWRPNGIRRAWYVFVYVCVLCDVCVMCVVSTKFKNKERTDGYLDLFFGFYLPPYFMSIFALFLCSDDRKEHIECNLDSIDEDQTMLRGNKLEVDGMNKRPNLPRSLNSGE